MLCAPPMKTSTVYETGGPLARQALDKLALVRGEGEVLHLDAEALLELGGQRQAEVRTGGATEDQPPFLARGREQLLPLLLPARPAQPRRAPPGRPPHRRPGRQARSAPADSRQAAPRRRRRIACVAACGDSSRWRPAHRAGPSSGSSGLRIGDSRAVSPILDSCEKSTPVSGRVAYPATGGGMLAVPAVPLSCPTRGTGRRP